MLKHDSHNNLPGVVLLALSVYQYSLAIEFLGCNSILATLSCASAVHLPLMTDCSVGLHSIRKKCINLQEHTKKERRKLKELPPGPQRAI